MLQAIFIDDEKGADVFAALLSAPGPKGLQVKFEQPNLHLAELAKKVLSARPDLVLLDYRLDQNPSENANANLYKAGPLAQQLRDHSIESPQDDVPIVLLSNEDNIKRLYVPDETAHDLFDAKYSKQRVQAQPEAVRGELLAIIEAYSRAKKVLSAGEKRLLPLLALHEDERAYVEHQALEKINKLTAPHLIIGQLFYHLIHRNGLLLNDESVLARLGVSPDSPDRDGLFQALSKGIQYSGALGNGWRRWWAHRLLKVLRDDQGAPDFFSWGAEKRVNFLNKVFKLKLAPAKSRWTGRTDALVTVSCASCRRPTELAVTVSAYDPYPHAFGEKRRICYSCLATGEYEAHELRVDEKDEFVHQQITTGKIKAPA